MNDLFPDLNLGAQLRSSLKPHNCNSCGVPPGKAHVPGCGVERCFLCKSQAISCHCVYEVNGLSGCLAIDHPDIYENGATDEMWEVFDKKVKESGGPELWSGIWPGTLECVELGFFSKWVPGKGWVECDGSDPEAGPDLNKLAMYCGYSVPEIKKRLAREKKA